MPEYAYVYILSSKGKRLYIGVTTKFEKRMRQHKDKAFPESFTAKYNIDQLVYFERHPVILAAIAREKVLKGWTRNKKVALIVADNPDWRDLSKDWGTAVDFFRVAEEMSPVRKTEILRRAAPQDDGEERVGGEGDEDGD